MTTLDVTAETGPGPLIERLGAEVGDRLAGLDIFVQGLERETLSAPAQVCLRTITDTLAEVRAMVDRAMALQDTVAGRLVLAPDAHMLRPMVDAVGERWRSRAAQLGVTLLTAYDGDPEAVAAIDGPRLAQIFDALVERALQVGGRGSIEIALAARLENGLLHLQGRVRDSGQEHDDLTAAIAVTLARRLTTAMGGQLAIQANIGAGATAVFALTAPPAVLAAEAPEPACAPPAAHVMIVDDNATNRMVVEALCDSFDCTCEQMEDGLEAVEAARSGRFDLILMDIKMPRMDGMTASRAIRALPGHAGGVPIIALTAQASPEDRDEYLAAGMQDLVEKPIAPHRLLAAMNRVLDAAAPAPQAIALAASA